MMKSICTFASLVCLTLSLSGFGAEIAEFTRIRLSPGVSLEMSVIPAGTFMMGSSGPDAEKDETRHEVTLSRPFLLGTYEVTQEQYEAVMGDNPSRSRGAGLPVESVSWENAKAFCGRLNSQYAGKLPDGYQFDLPTEAQWEYACRAGTATQYHAGDTLGRDMANFDGDEIRAVGSYGPNAWGLHDMHGNVWEWCRDWYGGYPDGAVTDPENSAPSSKRVCRGGGWFLDAPSCRSANRSSCAPSKNRDDLGFRLALVYVPKTEDNPAAEIPPTTEKQPKEKPHPQDSESSFALQLKDGVSLELIKVAHGSFKRGDGREITLTKDFWIGKYEVTQEQWKAVMGDQIKADNANQPAGTDTRRHPMENVTWDDAMAFCRKLNDMTSGQRPDGYDYSLPTEAQWEFAARGGTRSCGYEYSGSNICSEVAWYYENAGGERLDDEKRGVKPLNGNRTHEVGTKHGNELGIYDMSGNVWEWCRDWYGWDYASDPEFLLGQKTSTDRVNRGGSWYYDAWNCRAADRYCDAPSDRSNNLGFRLALVSVQR